jgi:hypothetical protein
MVRWAFCSLQVFGKQQHDRIYDRINSLLRAYGNAKRQGYTSKTIQVCLYVCVRVCVMYEGVVLIFFV